MGVITTNQSGHQLLAIRKILEKDIKKYHSIKRAGIIVKVNNKILLHFNQLQNQWELIHGKLNENETPQGGIKREWENKTQISMAKDILELNALLMIKNPNGEIRYKPIYFIEKEQLLLKETTNLILWDGVKNIGSIDNIHHVIIQPHLKGTGEMTS